MDAMPVFNVQYLVFSVQELPLMGSLHRRAGPETRDQSSVRIAADFLTRKGHSFGWAVD